MLELISGRPGSTKTLHLFKYICTEAKYKGRKKFYNNIKLNLLDYEQCKTFQAFFYDVFYPNLNKSEQTLLNDTLNPIHEKKRFVELFDLPFLEAPFKNHDPLNQWLKWVKICYSPSELKPLIQIMKNQPQGVEHTFKDFEALNLHWIYFYDPQKWYEMDGNSVLCIDEAQEFFPVRSGKDKVPLYASKFERHRHDSFDVILITQHPAFLDVHVRRLVGHHSHFFNYWGSKGITKYNWDKCVDPDDHFNKQEGQKTALKKPARYFGVYFSAFEHTHKLRLPKIIFLIPVLIIAVVLFIYFAFSTLFDDESSTSSDDSGFIESAMKSETGSRKTLTLEQYIAVRTPRLPDAPESAPIYDKLTQPKAFQKAKNCVLWKEGKEDEICICYSQRMTRLDVPSYLCKATVKNGYFDETLSDKSFSRKSQKNQNFPVPSYPSKNPTLPFRNSEARKGG